MGVSESRVSTGGTFRPVGFEQPAEPERRVRTDEEIDFQNLTKQEQQVVNAENFLIYGRANIEQWNDPAPGEHNLYIEMDAFEEKIDQLLAIENISFGHQDVRVGEPLESYTLETDATVHLSKDETLHFDAGDELRTQVIREGEPLPDGSGPAKEDALWLAANVFGRDDPRGSRFSQKVRLGAFYGDLDGFSVTIDKLEMTPTDKGVRTHEVDFLAVTIGDDEMIKNPGSSFGVAEFQALFGEVPDALSSDAVSPKGGLAEEAIQGTTVKHRLMGSIFQNLLSSSKDALASEAIEEARTSGIELQEAASEVAGDDADEVASLAEQKVEELEAEVSDLASEADDEDMDADDYEDKAAELAEATGMDKEFVMQMVEEARSMQEDMDEPDDPPEDPEDDEDDPETEGLTEEEVTAIVEEQLAERLPDGDLATSEEVQEALDGVASSEELEEQLSSLGESISGDIGEFVEEQMETGSTPGPTGGGVNVEDFESEAEEWADAVTGGGD